LHCSGLRGVFRSYPKRLQFCPSSYLSGHRAADFECVSKGKRERSRGSQQVSCVWQRAFGARHGVVVKTGDSRVGAVHREWMLKPRNSGTCALWVLITTRQRVRTSQ
jgi:hypothetical protein